MASAISAEKRKLDGKDPNFKQKLLGQLGELLVSGPIKDQFGLTRLRGAFTGGEAMGEDTFVFYRALGIKLRQLYGQTESSAYNAIQSLDEVRLHTVGRPLPGVELKISESGEILIRSGSVFSGYFKQEEATRQSLEDGWLHTGDAGYVEPDGHLVVLGRLSDVVHTAKGERYIPNYIENRLKFSPYIKDAAVLGRGRDTLAALICIDKDAVGLWAELRGISYISYADLSQKPQVIDLVASAVKHVNGTLLDGLQLRQFVCLHKEFDADDGEITRTRKIRRNVVEERYKPIIAHRPDEGAGQLRVGRGRRHRADAFGAGGLTMDWALLAESAVNGGLVGLMYSLVAMGIVLIYKSSSVPNLAQGSMTMLGAYVVLAFADNAGAPIWLAIVLAIVTMFGVGMAIERVALRRLAGRPIIMILMMTLGLEILLRAGSMTVWGGTGRPMPLGISDDPLFLGPMLINRTYAVGASVAIVMFGLFMLFFRTRMGLVLRAISDDYTAAWSVGISVERGVALSWAMSAVVATIAGILWASVQGVDQSLAQLLLKGVTVAVLGGMDSIAGALLAGILLGVVEGVAASFLDPLIGGASRDLVDAAMLILTIMLRPHGLYGRHDIERI
jgi:branched-subunit amino acid ABC-type transport system permease component